MDDTSKAARLTTARPLVIGPFEVMPRRERPRPPVLVATTPAPALVFNKLPPGKPQALPPGGRWRVESHWLGETVFVVASGPSLRHVNVDLIRGRKILCINSAYELVPFASMVYFGDARWWKAHKHTLVHSSIAMVTCSGLIKDPRVLWIDRLKPVSPSTGYTDNRNAVASQRTSLQGGMNLAAHLNSNDHVKGKIVLIAADMGRDPKTGQSHGHQPHKWPARPGNVTWDEQMRHLKWIVEPLKTRGIDVINTSMGSRIPWWPKMTLEDFLAKEKQK